MSDKYCMLGAAGSGKDTAGKEVARLLDIETYALASPIKDLVACLFNLTEEKMNGRDFKERKAFMRVFPDDLDRAIVVMQQYGLDKYQFPADAWDQWVTELSLTLQPEGYYEGWYSPRDLFQYFGTEWGRGIDDEIWIKLAPEDAVITDVRLFNEADFFLKKGYNFLEIVRPAQKAIEASSHITELGINHPGVTPITVVNNGSITDLLMNVEAVVRHNMMESIKS